jgi:hypothetical protein
MQGPSTFTNILVIPYGATSGERIVINGSTGSITGYGTDNRIKFVLTGVGLFFYA